MMTPLPLRDDVEARVQELLRNIAAGCQRLERENHNQANKRLAEEFLARVQRDYPGRCIARRQPIPTFHPRTTDANYIFTVPGQSREENIMYRVEAEISGRVARVRLRDVIGWGVETSLDKQVQEMLEEGSQKISPTQMPLQRIPVTEIHIENGPTFWRRFGLVRSLRALWHHAVGSVEEWAGRFSFAVFFLSAYLIAEVFNGVMDGAFAASETLAIWFFRFFWATMPATVALEFGVIAYLFAVEIPTRIDNSYRHLNKADNLLSLKRARHT